MWNAGSEPEIHPAWDKEREDKAPRWVRSEFARLRRIVREQQSMIDMQRAALGTRAEPEGVAYRSRLNRAVWLDPHDRNIRLPNGSTVRFDGPLYGLPDHPHEGSFDVQRMPEGHLEVSTWSGPIVTHSGASNRISLFQVGSPKRMAGEPYSWL